MNPFHKRAGWAMLATLTLSLLIAVLVSGRAWAAPPEPETPAASAASEIVDHDLIQAWKKRDQLHAEMSRALPTPLTRRVRMLDGEAKTDARGQTFLAFAIDSHPETWGSKKTADEVRWRRNVETGCVYPETREVFIQRKGKVLRGATLLGQKSERPPAGVCEAAPAVPTAS